MARGPAACIQVERAARSGLRAAEPQKRAVSISQSAVQQARVLYLSFVAEFLRTKPRMMIPPTARAVEHTVKYLWTHHTETKERDRGACLHAISVITPVPYKKAGWWRNHRPRWNKTMVGPRSNMLQSGVHNALEP